MARVRWRYVPPVPKYNYKLIIAATVATVVIVLIVCVIVGILLSVNKDSNPDKKFVRFFSEDDDEEPMDFMVDEARCKIPELIPTPLKELKIKRTKLQPCQNVRSLTAIVSTLDHNDPLVLKFSSEQLGYYKTISKESVNCSYRVVHRVPGSDSETYMSPIQGYINPDQDQVALSKSVEHLFVSCLSNGNEFYSNLHAVIARKEAFNDRQEELIEYGPYKVLMIGFDDMSRINFRRGLPTTHTFIQGDDWFEFEGYTRVSDESFGNIFSILTGQSVDQNYKNCHPKRSDKFLDDCEFIWKDFQEVGFITLFAEDQKNFSSCNKYSKGFNRQPTDYYYRPFVLESEKRLPIRNKGDLGFCLGQSLYLDHIFIYAMKMVEIHEDDPYFAFYYINSMSDKQLSTSPILDARIARSAVQALEELDDSDLIIIIFGDKGMRLEESITGFYEQRLPFLSIRLPSMFINEQPELAKTMRANLDKLTTPYDLHITLKHIINLSVGKTQFRKEAVGCPKCKSLFDKIPKVRSCLDASIPPHSCPCSLVDIESTKDVSRYAAEFAVGILNQNLAEDCEQLELDEVTEARQQRTAPWHMNYIVRFSVVQSEAEFEAVVSRKFSSLFSLTPQFKLMQKIDHVNVEEEPLCVPKAEVDRREMIDDDDDEKHYDLLESENLI